jgi:hypothetical protein
MAARSFPAGDEESESVFLPGYRNYLVYCDDSGLHGSTHYAFGSFWIPAQRRGTFPALVDALRDKHNMRDEFKWQKINTRNEAFYLDLVEMFFRRPWMMFHCLIVEKSYVDKDAHGGDYDLARRKHFAMLPKTKIQMLCAGGAKKLYHLRVDPLPSRYAKADEAAEKIINASLKKEIGHPAVRTLYTRDSKTTTGIQVTDVLLGAVMDDWAGKSTSAPKRSVKQAIAGHLGWPDLTRDTSPFEWKFNIWTFWNPKAGEKRPVRTRSVRLRFPMRLVEVRRNPRGTIG